MAKQNVDLKFNLVDGVSAGLTKIEKGVRGVATSLASIGVAAAAAGVAIAGVAIGSALTDGIKDAAAFEQALDRIGVKAGVADEDLAALGDTIRSISQDASRTGEEGAAAFERLTAEGLSATEAIAQLPAALNFATVASQSTTEAVAGLTDTLDIFGLASNNVGRAADVLSAGALAAGTSVGQLQAAIVAAGPTAATLNITLEQTTALLGVLAERGIEGGKAGKALAVILDQLRDPASRFSKELAAIGITSKDVPTVLEQLGKAGSKAEGAFTALGVNGTNAIKALASDGGAALKELQAAIDQSAGSTDRAAKALNDNLLGAFARAQEAFSALRAEFVEPLLGPLADELDAITLKLREFVESPEFDKLRTEFAKAFLEGLDAVEKFVAGFDFSDAVQNLQDFTRETGDSLRAFKQSADEVAAAVSAAVNGIAAAFNAIQTGVAAASTGSLRFFENVTGFFGNFSDTAKEASVNLRNFADIAEKETGVQAAQLADNLEALAGNLGAVSGELETSTEQAAQAAVKVAELSDAETRGANAAKIMADAERDHATAMAAAAKEAENLALGLDKAGNVIPIQAVTKATEETTTAFEQSQAQIQANIDATKQLASGYDSVAQSASDAAGAAEEVVNQLDQDLGSAVLRGLTEGFGRVTRDLAALRGVSEDVVRGELTNALQGATDSMRGLNDAIKRGDAEIEKLGGQEALQRLRDAAQRAAEAVANIGENARKAREDVAGLIDELQAEADARDGNATAQENARFRDQLDKIAQLEQASGGTDRATFARARDLANKNHQARLAEIRAEAQARIDAETGADAAIANSRAGAAPATGAVGAAPAAVPGGANPFGPGATINITVEAKAFTAGAGLEEAARALGPALNRIMRNSR